MGGTKEECVKVVVRCRPLSRKEVEDNRERIVDVNMGGRSITLKNPKGDDGAPKAFTFDEVFDQSVAQRLVYDLTASPIVDSVLSGFNGTVFAYGQTGTGKTHTMEGNASVPEEYGIIPNSFEHIFNAVANTGTTQFLIRASYLEIYNEEVRDLLAKNHKEKLEVKEHKDSGVYVKGLNSFVVKSVPEIRNVLEVGKKNRAVGATAMNQDSSRSHSIFTVTIESIEQGPSTDGHIRVGKLNLVDLAGSERQSKTGSTGDRLKEGIKINLSLTALGNVISALVDGKSGHVPYRDSKLTRLLQDSLGGNTKTVMVANVGPADWNYDETLSTLRYANRAKNIKNKPTVNQDPKDAMLKEFQDEIARLKAALAEADGGEGGDYDGELTIESTPPEVLEQMRAELEIQIRKDMADRMGGRALSSEQVAQIRQEAEAQARAEADRLAREKAEAEAEAARMAAQKAQLQQALAGAGEEAARARAEKEALSKKLKQLEKMIVKGESKGGIQEVMRKKEMELKKREEELARRREDEEAKAQKIAELEEAQLASSERYASKAEEAAGLTKKLKKLWKRYQEVNAEVEDAYAEFQREKEDLLDSIRMLHHQMQLKQMVIDQFIPVEETQKVMRRATWDEEREVWVLERLSDATKRNAGALKRPVSASGFRRPTSEFAKAQNERGDMNPRFRSENILNLELDMPERTTYDYDGPRVDARVQAAINAAFADDGELLFVGSEKEHMYLAEDASKVAGGGGAASSARTPMGSRQRPGSAARGR